MEHFSLAERLQDTLSGQVPAIIGALLLLLVGWIVALMAAALSRKILTTVELNDRVRRSTGIDANLEAIVARIAFWFIFLIALIASFNLLSLFNVSAPLSNMLGEVMTYLPRLVSGLVLLVVGWVLASLVRTGITKLLNSTSVDERLSAEAGMRPISENMGHVAYWLILLMFLPLILGVLDLDGLMQPVQNLIDNLLTYLPNIIAAAVIAVVGYAVAKVVSGIVSNLLGATRLSDAAAKIGLSDSVDLAKGIGSVVFLLIFVPALISALDALGIEAIAGPAKNLLDQLVSAVPGIIAAALIIVLTYYVARFASAFVTRLMASAGFDTLPEKIGMGQALGDRSLSTVIGQLVMFFAMLFASIEAAHQLGFSAVSQLVSAFIVFGSDILLGAVILLVGFWLANVIAGVVAQNNRSDSAWLSGLVRTLVIGLVIAMGLRAMGIADSIVNLAFGLTLGAVAVAFALAFGLGGREAAGKLLERWTSRQDD
ncbi:putative transporter (transmembrane protein) [Paraperlucidibaca baekdonensis]|uniref:Small-conductance mechanosensitive channel n=1 Tax=Paraperlucidibaca baekdonensis TaxID=748120 RepID=A0A3E0H1K3_9GAMM|nr:mechanosensitive ion channel [Paraperlucidibaca baekdonensis]REH36641.1 putative transporter (transmembrane protein) [Paraperlucidibaca baekdonensis]